MSTPLPSRFAVLRHCFFARASEATQLPSPLSACFVAPPLSTTFCQQYAELFDADQTPPLLTQFYPLGQWAQLALLSQQPLPFTLIGIIHLKNQLSVLDTIDPLQGFELNVSMAPMPVLANGAHGIALDVDYRQQEHSVLRCHSEYLTKRGTSRLVATAPEITAPLAHHHTLPPITADNIRRYAWISGDINPIHLHSRLAKWLRAPGQMAHGMYLNALIAHHLQRALQRPLQAIDIEFIKPVLLPALQLELWFGDAHFELRRHQRLFLRGTFR